MTDGTTMPENADALQTSYLATLLGEVQRLLGDVEQLVAGSRAGGAGLDAPALAARQAAIVATAHEEAAAVLASAHAAAARVLQGEVHAPAAGVGVAPPPASAVDPRPVLDLRDPTASGPPQSAPAPAIEREPVTPPVTPVTPPPDLQADMRASIAAAVDLARGLSHRIERLSQELHESPAP